MSRASDFWRRARAARFALVTAWVATLSPTSSIDAFEVLGSWPTTGFTYHINPNFPGDAAGTIEEQIAAMMCGASAWEDQTLSGFSLNFGGTTNVARIADDGIHSVFWANADGEGALAATLLAISETTNLISAFDIIFYAQTEGSALVWSGPGDPQAGTLDITGVAAHEFGHAVGLGHSDIQSATMFASASARALSLRTLHADDLDGIASLYGTVRESVPSSTLLSVDPTFGPETGGNVVTLGGFNFTLTADTTLQIDGLSVLSSRWHVQDCGKIVITDMPPHARGSVDITVSNSLGSSTLTSAYRYGEAPPTVNSISPNEGPTRGGIPIQVDGVGFSDGVVILIGDLPLESQTQVDATRIVGSLPASQTSGEQDVRVELDGQSIQTLDNAFTYNPYELRLVGNAAAPGTSTIVDVLATSPDSLGAFSFGLTFDPAVVSMREFSVEGTLSANADVSAQDIDNNLGVATLSVVISIVGNEEIPAGSDLLVARLVFDVDPTASPGTETELHVEDRLGAPPVLLRFEPVEGDAAVPFVSPSRLIVGSETPFIRGETNGDGNTDLADAVFVLNHLFRSGDGATCEKAMDVNDDGTIDISDPVRLIAALFQGEANTVPEPFPDPGLDPTPDDLECVP